MAQFTSTSVPGATAEFSAPLTISAELLADPLLSWIERILLARIEACRPRNAPTSARALAQYLGREPGTVRNLIASLVLRGYLEAEFARDPEAPWRAVRTLLPNWGSAEISAPTTETPVSASHARADLPALAGRESSVPPGVKATAAVPVPPHERMAERAAEPLPAVEEESERTDPPAAGPGPNPNPARNAPLTPNTALLTVPATGEPALPEAAQESARRLLAFGVDPPVAENLAQLRAPARVEATIERAQREGKGCGWVVKALRENWPVIREAGGGAGCSPGPRRRSDSPAVAATRVYRRSLREEGSWEDRPEERVGFEAMREALRQRLVGAGPVRRAA